MTVTFEDHALFHRTALRAAIGATALPVLFIALGIHEPAACAAAGALAALLSRRSNPVVLICLGATLAILAGQLGGARDPLLACVGILLACGIAEARAHRARELGEAAPQPWTFAAAAVLAGLVGWHLSAAVDRVHPLVFITFSGLWFAAACAPLHVRISVDRVEARLDQLRPTLLGDLRPLVERVALVRRDALAALLAQRAHFGPLVATLKAELDSLALAALELARRGAELAGAAPVSAEEDLAKRVAELQASAAVMPDEVAKSSYLRAAATLDAQLDHLRLVRRGRDRIAARLHEEVAQLERARFSLLLLQGANAERSAAELELLSNRMRQSAGAFEAEAEATAAVAVAAAALSRSPG